MITNSLVFLTRYFNVVQRMFSQGYLKLHDNHMVPIWFEHWTNNAPKTRPPVSRQPYARGKTGCFFLECGTLSGVVPHFSLTDTVICIASGWQTGASTSCHPKEHEGRLPSPTPRGPTSGDQGHGRWAQLSLQSCLPAFPLCCLTLCPFALKPLCPCHQIQTS